MAMPNEPKSSSGDILLLILSEIKSHVQWRIQGGATGTHPPPMGPDSFVLTYKFFETAASGVGAPHEVGAPLREILDPLLMWVHTMQVPWSAQCWWKLQLGTPAGNIFRFC